MTTLPLRSIPGWSWPIMPVGPVSQLWGLFLELERTQWLPAETILAGQLAQVRDLLAHCRQHVPYYEKTLHDAGIDPASIRTLDDFRRIPVLTRRTYQEQFPLFQARQLPSGLVQSGQGKTSGTGGIPIQVLQTNLVALWWRACFLRDLVWSHFDPRGSLASIRNLQLGGLDPNDARQGVRFHCWNPALESLLATGPSYGLDIQQNPAEQLAWLRLVAPNYLLSTPSNVVVLARLLAESGQPIPSLRAIQVIAESLSEEDRARIESAFGVPVKNLYSCMEAGYLASPCPEGHGLHVHAENVLLEVLNEENQPCGPGETGRVLLTTLRNHLTPFVRYEILDRVTLGAERCPCGRGLPLLERVEGKIRPLFPLPGGTYKASHALVHHLFHLDVYHQHQIIQRARDHFIIRLVPNRLWAEDSAECVVRSIQEFLEVPVRIEVELVERIPTTAAGKVRDIIIEVQEEIV